jgi:hypothetical protein
MSIPRVFRSTDAEAPTWSYSVGSFQRVMKAIVKDGYGDTLPLAGWTWEYEVVDDTFVIRNDPTLGSGTFYQISNSTNKDYSGVCFMYDTMTDANTGLGQVPNPSFTKNNKWGNFLWASKRDTAYEWVIIADERTIYAFAVLYPSNYPDLQPAYPIIFGDYSRSTGLSADSGMSVTGTYTYDSGYSSSENWISKVYDNWSAVPSNYKYICINKNLTGESDILASLYCQVGTINHVVNTDKSTPIYPDPNISHFETHKIYVKAETSDMDKQIQFMGTIRGLFKTNFKNASGKIYDEAGLEFGIIEEITLNDIRYMGIPVVQNNPSSYYNISYILVDITNEWES